MLNDQYLIGLLIKYRIELESLARDLQPKAHEIIAKYSAGFTDFEGEVLYCLIRDRRPNCVYEISPDCGYSTIYVTEALRRNGRGKVWSFEIEEEKRGKPTLEVIKENTLDTKSLEFFELVIGDASCTTLAYPDPDIVLIDSCHEAWFAEWYWHQLFPRVKDIVLIQDILFWDRQEYSSEATSILRKISEESTPYISLGVLERKDSVQASRRTYAPRCPRQSSAILMSFNDKLITVASCTDDVMSENDLPMDIDNEHLAIAENHINGLPERVNKYRNFLNLSDVYQLRGDMRLAKYYWRRACGEGLADSLDKGVFVLLVLCFSQKRIRKLISVFCLALFHRPTSLKRFCRWLLGKDHHHL